MRKIYRGEGIEVSFDLDRCIHIGECLLTLPEVFDLKRRPWIEADGADPDEVADTVLRCPSGALMFRRLDGGPEEAHETTTVEPMRNGPLRVTGEIHVRLDDGTEETLPRATLCRCPLFLGVRTYTLTPEEDNPSTRFEMTEVFSGLMLPMIGGRLRDFGPIFERYAADPKARAEAVKGIRSV